MRTHPHMLAPLFVLTLNAWPQFELPRLDTANFLPAIRTQIDQAAAAARAHPRDPKTVGRLAMILHAYQQYDAAARVYASARLLEPRNFDWLYLLGAAQKAQGAFEEAVESFRSALRIRPDDAAAQLRLAESLSAAAGWEDAGVAYRRILDKQGDSPQAWYGLGRAQMAKGDHEAAARSFAKACDLFPQYGAAHFALARELRRLGKQAKAEQHLAAYSINVTVEPPLADPLFERIHELNHSTILHLERGRELEKAGRYADAIREHETALESDPANVQIHVNLISLYGRIGDTARARQHFEAATRLNPGRSDAWYDYGVLLFHEKEYVEAERAYRRALEINPFYAEAHNNLGLIEEEQGKFNEAVKDFREAIEDRPDYPLARFHLGRILVHQERYGEAIPHFRRCLEPESEQTPACLYALGATYARSGDRPHAREYLQKARSAAAAHNQPLLQASIERDLNVLQDKP
jgi:tetratricopeptide (TPR) repeat protein